MKGVHLRRLEENDIGNVTELLNRSLEMDRFSPDWVSHKSMGDPDYAPDLCLIGEREGKTVGFVQGIVRRDPEGEHGCIKMVAVDPEHRRQGVASALLDRVEGALAERTGEVRVLFSRPNYFLPGLDPHYTPAASFFLSRGYAQTGDGFNMGVNLAPGSEFDSILADWEEQRKQRGAGFRLIRPSPDDESRVKEWLSETGVSFSWVYQATHAFRLAKLGLAPEPGLIVAERDGEWVGFAAYNAVLPGWFGPEWVRSDLRGHGIGKALLMEALRGIRNAGHGRAEICLVVPLPFYAKSVNATVTRTWWFLSKRL
jgi:ribosomal protein S18 acetylase RimI-like enzyme